MRLRLVYCLLAALAMLFSATHVHAQTRIPAVDEAFRLQVSRTEAGEIRLAWTITKDAYLYRSSIAATAPGGRSVPVETPGGTQKDDPVFGLTEVMEQDAFAIIRVGPKPEGGPLTITYQGCHGTFGVCYPPVRKAIDPATLAVAEAGAEAASPGAESLSFAPVAAGIPPTPTQAGGSDHWMSMGILPLVTVFVGFGLLLTFTPCVLPLVPILSGMLVRSGASTPARGFALSLAYVLAMASAYALLGVVAAWSGQNLQIALQSPWALGAMSLVFVVLALSMFGLFELQAPGFITNRITSRATPARGTLPGAALLGFTSALIVGPCVTPPLAGALLYVSQTGDVTRGAAALFALGLGMGLPLLTLGVLGPRALPRSGPWLVKVKYAFGVMFLATALFLAGRVLPGPLTLALWGILAIGTGIFLGALDQRSQRAAPRLARALGVIALVYGSAMLIGAASGGDDPLRPLARSEAELGPNDNSSHIVTVKTLAGFDQAMAAARGVQRPTVVEFTADWCSVCKENERNVLGTPAVQQGLAQASVIRVDVTSNDRDTRTLMQRFNVVGPPTILFISAANSHEASELRVTGSVDVEQFLKRLSAINL